MMEVWMRIVEGDRGTTSGSGPAAVSASAAPNLSEAVLPPVPAAPGETLDEKFGHAKAGRINQSTMFAHICNEIGRRGFVADQRPSAEGTEIDLLVSSLHKKLFSFLAMPEWSDRTHSMALGGFDRRISHVRVNADNPADYRILSEVTINPFKNFAVALKPDGTGFAVNVDADERSRGIVRVYGADARLEHEIKTNKTSGSPRDFDGSRIYDLEYGSKGELYAGLKTPYGDPKWEKLTG